MTGGTSGVAENVCPVSFAASRSRHPPMDLPMPGRGGALPASVPSTVEGGRSAFNDPLFAASLASISASRCLWRAAFSSKILQVINSQSFCSLHARVLTFVPRHAWLSLLQPSVVSLRQGQPSPPLLFAIVPPVLFPHVH